VLFERVYYVGTETPSKGYSALVGALRETETAGICTWTMRKRSYLGALNVTCQALRLNVLRHTDEMISVKSLELQRIALAERELKIGIDLINQWTGSFEPEKFENEHQKKLRQLIDRKARGERTSILRPRRLKPTTSDKLLEALEASLKRVA
jgi:DNA end-binding protein Ku